jgi:hypothetical protein
MFFPSQTLSAASGSVLAGHPSAIDAGVVSCCGPDSRRRRPLGPHACAGDEGSITLRQDCARGHAARASGVGHADTRRILRACADPSAPPLRRAVDVGDFGGNGASSGVACRACSSRWLLTLAPLDAPAVFVILEPMAFRPVSLAPGCRLSK